MQKRTLPLSLLIGATLSISSLAIAAPADTQAVDTATASAESVPETEVDSIEANNNNTQVESEQDESTKNKSTEGELLTAQSSAFEISETKTISRSSSPINSTEALATEVAEVETVQDQEDVLVAPEEAAQDQEED